jgi:serine/threonine protein kinase
MESPDTQAERDIFAAAASLPPEERAAYLDAACAVRPELRVNVEAWLEAHEGCGFMAAEEEAERLRVEQAGEHIAKVFDAGATESGRPFFVMELVRGVKITEYCDQANLPTAGRLDIFIQVCHAVQHAHQKEIIHRDLKPSNILVALHDGVPVPKVIDFGVAKATQRQLADQTIYTQFQQMVGTPLYISPEQAEMSGLDVDTRSDIYSLGVLLYELLTGRTPFDPDELLRQGLDEIRRVIREREPQTPSTFLRSMGDATRALVARHRQANPGRLMKLVRGDLDWIVMKALEKDRKRRYDTANGLAMDLQRHLAHEPVARAAAHRDLSPRADLPTQQACFRQRRRGGRGTAAGGGRPRGQQDADHEREESEGYRVPREGRGLGGCRGAALPRAVESSAGGSLQPANGPASRWLGIAGRSRPHPSGRAAAR